MGGGGGGLFTPLSYSLLKIQPRAQADSGKNREYKNPNVATYKNTPTIETATHKMVIRIFGKISKEDDENSCIITTSSLLPSSSLGLGLGREVGPEVGLRVGPDSEGGDVGGSWYVGTSYSESLPLNSSSKRVGSDKLVVPEVGLKVGREGYGVGEEGSEGGFGVGLLAGLDVGLYVGW